MRNVLSQNLLNETRENIDDMSFSLNRSFGSTITKIVVLPCNLTETTSATLQQLASKHKVKIVNEFV